MPKAKRPSISSAKLLPVKAGMMPPTQCRPVPMSIMFLRVTFLFTRAPATRVKMTAQRLGMLFTRVIRLYGTSEKLAEMFTRAEVHQSAPAAEVLAIRSTIRPIMEALLSVFSTIQRSFRYFVDNCSLKHSPQAEPEGNAVFFGGLA